MRQSPKAFIEAHRLHKSKDREAFYIPSDDDIILNLNATWLCVRPSGWTILFTETHNNSNMRDVLKLITALYLDYDIDIITVECRSGLWQKLLQHYEYKKECLYAGRDIYTISIKQNISKLGKVIAHG